MHVSRKINPDFDKPTTELYLSQVIDNYTCRYHKKPQGVPCYMEQGATNEHRPIVGICNQRAVLAGFNGYIQPSSLDRSIRKGARV